LGPCVESLPVFEFGRVEGVRSGRVRKVERTTCSGHVDAIEASKRGDVSKVQSDSTDAYQSLKLYIKNGYIVSRKGELAGHCRVTKPTSILVVLQG